MVGNVVPKCLNFVFVVEWLKMREESSPFWFFIQGEVEVCDAGDFCQSIICLCLESRVITLTGMGGDLDKRVLFINVWRRFRDRLFAHNVVEAVPIVVVGHADDKVARWLAIDKWVFGSITCHIRVFFPIG